jgi:mRNA interferase MazF
MPSYSKGEVVLVRFPFSDRSESKVRPAIAVSASHPSQDVFVVPLTSRTDRLLSGEFVMNDWEAAGLNIASAVKRGIYTLHQDLIIRTVGTLSAKDAIELERSLKAWLGL